MAALLGDSPDKLRKASDHIPAKAGWEGSATPPPFWEAFSEAAQSTRPPTGMCPNRKCTAGPSGSATPPV
jgi:hypothetical protein